MDSDNAYRCHQRAWRQHKAELRAFLSRQCRSTAEAEEYKLERLKKRLDTATAAEVSHRG